VPAAVALVGATIVALTDESSVPAAASLVPVEAAQQAVEAGANGAKKGFVFILALGAGGARGGWRKASRGH